MTVAAANLTGAPPSWSVAACAGLDPDLFFPERGASTRNAKAVCASCAVRVECLEFALAGKERFGVWGGTSERERRRGRHSRHSASPWSSSSPQPPQPSPAAAPAAAT